MRRIRGVIAAAALTVACGLGTSPSQEPPGGPRSFTLAIALRLC